eukprot:TRINITY_DN16_c0_g8_i1.p1 TRINITY_DN16_c0_g8~~TRINITY_DN16_c0_g8_i1.p1  ORF type:complete len:1193 (-),score=320.78 TRINITY_DN16_c0_g8_i1:96-3674(-)
MDKVEETDPTGRFVRLSELLGSGAFKSVYKAIDRDRGIEVAWNQLRLDRFQDQDFIKLYGEIQILGQLKHQHIIEFYGSWINEQKQEVVFITECMTSGTLKQFIRRARNLKLSVIQNWCIQILKGLNYLHTRTPPIIHRDIKCDNIFINGSLGEVKIGDLGLATVKKSNNALSVIGTPEFMAPEYYEEKYTEKVDIWAFGLCVLEMVTHDYPYSECSNPAQIFKRVSTGNLPAGLERIKDEDVRAFIRLCLAPEHQRPSAAELLKHPFLCGSALDDERQVPIVDNIPRLEANGQPPSAPTSMSNPLAHEQQYTITFGEEEGPVVTETQIVAVDTSQYADKIILKLMLCVADERREIEFPFDLKIDKSSEVATEMVQALQLPKSSLVTIASLIQNHVDEATKQREEKKKRQEHLINSGIPVTDGGSGNNSPIVGTGSSDSHVPVILPSPSDPSLAASSSSLNAPIALGMASPSLPSVPTGIPTNMVQMPSAVPASVLTNLVATASPSPSMISVPSPVVALPPAAVVSQQSQSLPPTNVQPLNVSALVSGVALNSMSASLPTLPSVTVPTLPVTSYVPPPLAPSISSPNIPATVATISASAPLLPLASAISSVSVAHPTSHSSSNTPNVTSPTDSPTTRRKLIGEHDPNHYHGVSSSLLSDLLNHHTAEAERSEDEDEDFMNQMYQALLLKHQKEREALEQKQMEELRRFESVREKKRRDFGMSLQQIDKSNSNQRYVTTPAPTQSLPHSSISTPSLYQPQAQSQPQPQPQTQPQSVLSHSTQAAQFNAPFVQQQPQPQPQQPVYLPTQPPLYQPQIPVQASQSQPMIPPHVPATLPMAQQPTHLYQQPQAPVSVSLPTTPTIQPAHLAMQTPFQQFAQTPQTASAQLQLQQSQQPQPSQLGNSNVQMKEKKDKDLASKLTAITMKSLEAFSNSGHKLGETVQQQQLQQQQQYPPQHAQSQPPSLGYLMQAHQATPPVSLTHPLQPSHQGNPIITGYVLPPNNAATLGSKTPTPPTSGSLMNTPIPYPSTSGYTSPTGTMPIPIPSPTPVPSSAQLSGSVPGSNATMASFINSCISPPSSFTPANTFVANFAQSTVAGGLLTPASPPSVFTSSSAGPLSTHSSAHSGLNKSGSRTPPNLSGGAGSGMPSHAQLLDALFTNVTIPEKPSSNPIPASVGLSIPLHHPPSSLGATVE